jgi:hypothetical protein
MSLFGGLFDTEGMVKTTIESCLENVAEELNCSHKELFIKIVSKNENFEPEFHIYRTKPYDDITKTPALMFERKIELKEILGQ